MNSLWFITRSVRVISGAILACVLLTAGISAHAQDFNLSRDFSTNSNPHGVWSYGAEGTLGGTFSLATLAGQGFGDNGVPYEAWSQGSGEAPFFSHFPFSNSETATSDRIELHPSAVPMVFR
ncbi:MAG TPA: hypothetical protein VGF13_14895 [Verrucomicrobiae bacterium]|jgi:hypothetical protein